MTYSHSMPFGAQVGAESVSFRLWAPAAERVEVEIGPAPTVRPIPLEPRGGGWFHVEAGRDSVGAAYRFRIDGEAMVPDPASRFQPEGPQGPSRVVDPRAYAWKHPDWQGRPWEEVVFYELHVGAFTTDGTYRGVESRLDHLVDLGVTAVELMPVATFAGMRGWGYDGVLPYAPFAPYGGPDDLKALVDAVHARGLMIFLDVVYNHFGPEGNHLHRYAPDFFTDRFHTPWGAAIDFARREVRDFFIHNALYWLEEFRFDGLRLDAVHAIHDESPTHVLEELAARVREGVAPDRRIHLVLENGNNEARFLARGGEGRPDHYVAQWNDDIHHALHVVATDEDEGYYRAYSSDPVGHLQRCLVEGFSFQGAPFPDLKGEPRGEPSGHLPPTAFVSFLQNHDQIGNRALGERLSVLADADRLDTLLAVLLLAPQVPLLFMGEEWGAPEPFLFFCDFHDELADRVREGRRREFADFPAFRTEDARRRIPDPNAEETFRRSVLDWSRPASAAHAERLALYRELLALRRRELFPRLSGGASSAQSQDLGSGAFSVAWTLSDGSPWTLLLNPGDGQAKGVPTGAPGTPVFTTDPTFLELLERGRLPPWSAGWFSR